MRNEPTLVERPPLGAQPARPAAPVRDDTPTTTRTLPLHDPEALGRLLLALEPRLVAVAVRITRNPDVARDVVQDAFEKVLRHGERFAGQSRVSTWLHRIVTNEALMWLRSRKRRGELQDTAEALTLESLQDSRPDPAEAAERRQDARHLHALIDRLGEDERDVIVRCGLRDESYAAYAKRAGLHPGAVKTRAFRGRRRLEALLAEV